MYQNNLTRNGRRGRSSRPLDAGYMVEVDQLDEKAWYRLLASFRDANIYQTWAYAFVRDGRARMSHLVLRRAGEVLAIAQSRLVTIPLLGAGIAYVMWGPVWRRTTGSDDIEIFRQVIRALRNEYVSKRGLLLRVYPALFDADQTRYQPVLEAEGFELRTDLPSSRTIIMDLNPSLDELREQLRKHWRKELKVAEKQPVTVLDGDGEELFEQFIPIYKEMVARKGFREPNDVAEFRAIQRLLPADLKMRLMLCTSSAGHCAGVVASTIGDTGLYLFGATSSVGMRARGSYLLQWRLIQHLQSMGIARYDLNGINPDANPGTYKFKKDLAGENAKEVRFLGQFECKDNWMSSVLVKAGERIRAARRGLGAGATTQ